MTGASRRRFNRLDEELDVVGSDHGRVAADTTHFNAIADAQVCESGAADIHLRRAVDCSAEAVVLRRNGVSLNSDLSILIIVGLDRETPSAFVDVRDGADERAADAFADVVACPPLTTRLSESGDSDREKKPKSR